MECFLGIDAGTSGIKAMIIDEKGNNRGIGYCECDIISPNPGWAEQNPKTWWHACDIAVKEAVLKSGCGKDIKGIGFSGQMQGSTFINKNLEPIGNCIIWLDQRATQEVKEIEAIIPANEMLNITANHCLNSFWAPKLLWFKKNEPKAYENIYKILFTKDYLRLKITGELATEVSDASFSFLMDVEGRKWSKEMFSKLGIDSDIVPDKLAESCDVVGRLKKDIAIEWGLHEGIPVVAGGGDQPAGGVGTGVVKTGRLGATIGTSGVVFGCCDKPFKDVKNRATYSLAHSVPGKWCFLGLVLTAGGSFKWLRDTIFADKKTSLAAEGKDIYDYMTGLAARSAPGCEGLVFLPYLNGEKTPVSDENARGVFFGLSSRHSQNDICRSVMEGVTFALRDTIEILREFGTDINEVRANGGGAKSDLWLQMQADIYKANVVTMNMEEGPAAGAAIMAAVGSGAFATVNEACDSIVRIKKVTEPNRENVKKYDDYYQTYGALYPVLKDIYKKQASNVGKHIK
jgi:xylulokinase